MSQSEFIIQHYIDPFFDLFNPQSINMAIITAASKGLEAMLQHMGVSATVTGVETESGPLIQIKTDQDKQIIGRHGEKLDELQTMLNQMVVKHFPDAPRVRVDCNGFRADKENLLVTQMKKAAQGVLETGEPYESRPLNSYFRRLAHNAVEEISGVKSVSEDTDRRLKKITILPE